VTDWHLVPQLQRNSGISPFLDMKMTHSPIGSAVMGRRDGEPRRAAIYARISKDVTLQGQGVDRQLADCRKYADLAGWVVDERWVLVENDTSATKGPRPKFDRLVHGMRSGAFDVVLVWALDRLVRTLSDSALIHELLAETRVHLASADRRIDTSSESGAAQLAIWSALAQIEISNLRSRVKRAAQQNLERGRPTNGGSRPFGWELDRKTVRLSEAAVIRDVAGRVLAGSSLSSMCRYLNDQQILTPGRAERGVDNQPTGRVVAQGRWDTPRLKKMLTLPRHFGLQTYKGDIVRDEAGEPRRIMWTGGGAAAPILDLEMREPLLAAVQARSFMPEVWSNQRQHALSGLVVCGVCDQPMSTTYQSARSGRAPVWVYRCKGHLSRSRDLLERWVFDRVIERAREQRWEIGRWESVDRDALRGQVETKRRALADLEDEFIRNGGSAAVLARMTSKLEEEIAALEEGLLRELAYSTGVRWAKIRFDEQLAESASLMPTDPPGTTTKLDRMDQQRNCFLLYAEKVRVLPSKKGRGFDPGSVQMVWREGDPFIETAVTDRPLPPHLANADTFETSAEHVAPDDRYG
jgi:site-specific DNA recombinase